VKDLSIFPYISHLPKPFLPLQTPKQSLKVDLLGIPWRQTIYELVYIRVLRVEGKVKVMTMSYPIVVVV